MPSAPDISVVIVSYNTEALLRNCLSTLFRHAEGLSLEVYVVDNASADGSVAMVEREFPAVELICNRINVGYSKANNQALRRVTGRHILLLNSDTEMQPNTLQASLNYLQEHPQVGALTCKVVLKSGELDPACRRSFPTPIVAFWHLVGLAKLFPKSKTFARYNLTYLDENDTYEVDAIMGAFMMLQRETLLEIGMLDESFFMYGEDLDWCYRIRRSGRSIVYYPDVSIRHIKGASSGQRRPQRMVQEFHRAMVLFYHKYFARRHVFVVNWVINIGVGLHFLADSLQSILFFRFHKRAVPVRRQTTQQQ